MLQRRSHFFTTASSEYLLRQTEVKETHSDSIVNQEKCELRSITIASIRLIGIYLV
jgi:hypothetical protein